MGQYSADSVHKRIDFAQYTFKQYPSSFDDIQFPIVVYSRDGVIAGANRYFRNIAEVTVEDIQLNKLNIFDYLDDKNAVLIDAAHNAFDGEEKVYEDIGCALRAEPGTVKYLQLADYPNAIFFPMAYDRGAVRLGAVLLDMKETDND